MATIDENKIQWDSQLPQPDKIQWDSDVTPKSEPAERETSFGGVTKEFLKGLPRGAVDYFKQLGAGLDPRGQQAWGPSMPQDKLPAVDPGIGQLNQQFQQAVAPDQQATGMESFAGKTGEFLGGFAGGSGPQAANRSLFPTVPTARTNVMRELHDAGVSLNASQMGGTTARAMEGLGDKARINQMLQNKNVETFQGMASQATGVPASNLTAKALDYASAAVSAQTYQPLRDMGTAYFGSHAGRYVHPFQQSLDNIASKYQHTKGFDDVSRNINSLRVRDMPMNTALERVQQIRNEAGSAFKAGNREAGKGLREVAKAMEDQFERQLGHNAAPEVVQAYRAGRAQIARNNAVKDMLVDADTGIIDAVKARQLRKDKVPLDGPLLTIAKAGSRQFADATKAPTGQAQMFNNTDYLMGGIGGIGGFMAGGVPGAVAAAAPMARVGMRKGIVSNAGQNMMARNLYDQPGMLGMSPDFIQRMLTGGTGLFSDGETE